MFHAAGGGSHDEDEVGPQQGDGQHCDRRFPGQRPHDPKPRPQRDQSPEDRHAAQREQAEAEEFVPAGLKQQVQRHHPVGVQSQTEGLGVVRRGRDHRCDEFAVGSQIESGAGEPCLVAPWSAAQRHGNRGRQKYRGDSKPSTAAECARPKSRLRLQCMDTAANRFRAGRLTDASLFPQPPGRNEKDTDRTEGGRH